MAQPPRLLLVVSLLGAGGVERHNLELLDDLVRRGWASTVVVTMPGEHVWYEKFAELASDVVLIYDEGAEEAPRRLAELMRTQDPDILMVANSWLGYVLLPYLRSENASTAIVDVIHSFPPTSDGGYARMSVDHADEIDLTISVGGRFVQTWMRDRGRTRENVEVCYIGIDIERWKPDPDRRASVRAELGLDDDRPLIAFVGRFSEEKRPLLALEVCERLARRNMTFALVMVGDGPEREEVTAFVRRRNLQNHVRFEGNVPPERVMALFKAADIYLQTSKYEGMSVALMEAMASGLCVVGPEVGGQAEVAAPGTGVLIPRGRRPNDELERYASAVASLVNDRSRRAAMGRSARDHLVANFGRDGARERLWRALQHAREVHRSTPPPPPAPEAIRSAIERATLDLRLLEQSPISRRVAFSDRRATRPKERMYRAIRRHGRPVYWWARRRLPALDRINERLKRWVVR